MQVEVDKTGFPWVVAEEIGLAFLLWPVSKVQFERFMSESNRYGDRWYEELLSLNPRLSYRHFSPEIYERIFIAGVLPEEAIDFGNWLGGKADLPTVQEWRSIYRFLQGRWRYPDPPATLSPAASTLWKELQRCVQTVVEFALMQGGMVEWVKAEKQFVGLGSPRASFHPNAWDPLTDTVKPLKRGRIPFFGFRLVRRLGR